MNTYTFLLQGSFVLIKRIKNINLALCIVPGLMLANNSADQVQQLQNALQEKKAELSEIEEKIAAQEELIDAILERGGKLYYEIYAGLSSEAQGFFKEEVDFFEQAADEAIHCVEGMHELFMKQFSCENESNRKKLERIKFVLIRQAVEYCFLRELFESYLKVLHEL